ncbi:hypothetical protein DIPPA_12985 [Diplonema papillatum]|nr:hypothetical protein DIPPA_12985 [Diplonema papillatum]
MSVRSSSKTGASPSVAAFADKLTPPAVSVEGDDRPAADTRAGPPCPATGTGGMDPSVSGSEEANSEPASLKRTDSWTSGEGSRVADARSLVSVRSESAVSLSPGSSS